MPNDSKTPVWDQIWLNVYCKLGHKWKSRGKTLTPSLKPHEAGFRAKLVVDKCPECGGEAWAWGGPTDPPPAAHEVSA